MLRIVSAAPDHVVQFYRSDEQALYANVARYIVEGFAGDEAAVVVATPEHAEAFFDAIEAEGVDGAAAVRESRLVLLDAESLLAKFMVNGYPNAAFFASVVGDAVREAPIRSAASGVRIYGEMVGVLWEQGEYPAAIRLEQLWNKLLGDFPCSLLCGYPVDPLDAHVDAGMLDAVLEAHTHMLPVANDKALKAVVIHAARAAVPARRR